jgi:hypothetical protein
MPAYTRGSTRDVLTFVKVNPVLLYGWKAPDLTAKLGIDAVDLDVELGHMSSTAAAAVVGAILVIGANSPKPARVVKRDKTAPVNQTASTSTFISFDRAAAATTAGWTLSSPARGVRLTANMPGNRSITAIAELSNGALYAFPMNQADFTLVGAELGLTDSSSVTTTLERQRLLTGARTRPGKCSKIVGPGMMSTYFATDSEGAAITAGWSIDRPESIQFA